MDYPKGYFEAKDRYAKLMRKAMRTGGRPLSDVARQLGIAWSERYTTAEREAAVIAANKLMDQR